jgi:hypothetical protein
MLTTSDTLLIGVVVGGVVHKDFVLRTATVDDNIGATEELIEAGENPQALRISTALLARQLIKLGTLIPHGNAEEVPPEITTSLLRGMHPADWNVLDKASNELEKKIRKEGPLPRKTGGSPSELGPSETGSTQTN